MATVVLRRSVEPRLLHSISNGRRSVELWKTTCIVSNFGKSRTGCTALINPSNPQLSGTRNFPYFPRGGPVPKEKPMSMHKDWQPLGFVSSWGGMEVGSGMLYPVSVIDGLVHQWGGTQLQAECRLREIVALGREACPTGEAVVTSSGNGVLRKEYDQIVHTAPPFFRHHDDPKGALSRCYHNSISKGTERHKRVATALIGAGARGFPTSVAIEIAAASIQKWINVEGDGDPWPLAIVFGLLEAHHADLLFDGIKRVT